MTDLDPGFTLGDRLVEPSRSLVTHADGEARRLEPRAMAALVRLATSPGEVVRREALIDEVWRTTVGDEVLSRAVSLIRQALGDDARSPRFVETVPKIGYRLLVDPGPAPSASSAAAPVERGAEGPERPVPLDAPEPGTGPGTAPEPTTEPSSTPAHGTPAEGAIAFPDPPSTSRKRPTLLALGGVAGLLLAILAWVLIARLPAPSDAPPSAPRSVAVLPLEDLAVAGESRPLGLGLSDLLRAELGRNASLRVLARSSSMAVAREAQDARAVGEALGIDAVLEGSVVQGFDRVTVHLTLSDARDGYQRWAESFEGTAAELFEMSNMMVRQIETELASAGPRPETGAAPDAEAWTLYLQGLHHFATRGADGLQRSERLFRQALEVDPDLDAARVALARTIALTPYWTPVDETTVFPQALEILDGLESGDPLTEGRAAAIRGFVDFRRWRWEAAGAHFDEALRLAPQDPGIRAWHAQYLAALGELEASLAEAREAWNLDPGSPIVGSRVAIGELWLDRPEAAARFYDTSDPVDLVRRDPSYLVYLLRTGRDDDVRDLLRRVHEAAGRSTDWIDACLALIRDAPDRASHLRTFESAVEDGRVLPRMQFAIWILAGEYERATDFIDRFRDRRREVDVEFMFAAAAAGYRDHPSFERALALIGHPRAG